MNTPIHNCPVQGPDTEYQRTLNIKTNQHGWICIWCEMAKKMGQPAPLPPTTNPTNATKGEDDR